MAGNIVSEKKSMEISDLQILQLHTDSEETDGAKAQKKEIAKKLEDAIAEIVPGAKLVAVGSCGNGFEVLGSDLDVTVLLPRGHSNISFLRDLERILRQKGTYRDIQVPS